MRPLPGVGVVVQGPGHHKCRGVGAARKIQDQKNAFGRALNSAHSTGFRELALKTFQFELLILIQQWLYG